MPNPVLHAPLPRRKTLAFKNPDGTKIQLYAGLYLMSGVTASGKSVNAAALFHRLMEKGAGYAHINEATGEILKDSSLDAEIKGTPQTKDFQVLIYDSWTLNLLNVPNTENLPTFKKGLMPAHIGWLLSRQYAARAAERTIIATLNSELFPVGDLEGAVEGAIHIRGIGRLEKRDRSKRQWEDVNLNQEDIDYAVSLLDMSGKIDIDKGIAFPSFGSGKE